MNSLPTLSLKIFACWLGVGCVLQPSAATDSRYDRSGRSKARDVVDVSDDHHAHAGRHAHDAAVPDLRDAHPEAADAPVDAAVSGDTSVVDDDPGLISDEAGAPEPARAVFVDDILNARDLGGTSLGPGRKVASGVLYRGPALAGFSAAGCSEFRELGIHTVLDLRSPSEVAGLPESACVADAARIALAPLPIPYNVNATDYIAVMNTTSSIALTFRELGASDAYPIYFHCTYGRDRSGVVAALVLAALGASRQVILDEYNLSRLQVGAYPAALEGALDEIERHGGIESYLSTVGVSAEQLAVLRAHAIAHTR
jgi:protein-tyrosine phosphatase